MSSTQPRVLIVDDSLEMARTIADDLVERGYEAIAVAGGHEALAQLASASIDAVVTDLRMPGLDGLDVLAAARRANPHCPVIVMTAYSAIGGAIDSIRRGAAHYLTKPFQLEELAIFLERALDERRVRREVATLRILLDDLGIDRGIGRPDR